MSHTIEEMIAAKESLRKGIEEKLRAFESEYGVKIQRAEYEPVLYKALGMEATIGEFVIEVKL